MPEYQDKRCVLKRQIEIDGIYSVLYYEFTKDFNFLGEAHDYWEFVYADKGEVIATAEDEDIFLKQGEIIFHKPNEFHRIRSNGIIAPNVIVVSFRSPSPAMEYFNNKRFTVPEKLRWLLGEIITEFNKTFKKNSLELKKNPTRGSEHILLNYLEIFLVKLSQEDSGNNSFSQAEAIQNQLVCEMISIMENNLYKNIDISYICENTHYSKTYLCTLFKKYTGVGIMHYFNNMKIQEAKRILREQKMNLTEISDSLGFDNPHYFTKVFRRFTGMSTREYMKSVDKVFK